MNPKLADVLVLLELALSTLTLSNLAETEKAIVAGYIVEAIDLLWRIRDDEPTE